MAFRVAGELARRCSPQPKPLPHFLIGLLVLMCNALANTTPHTITGELQIIRRSICFRQISRAHYPRVETASKLSERSRRNFPVLYMQDGQNCFDRHECLWQVNGRIDETLTKLIGEGKMPAMIVVGIDNAGADRIKEYTFVPDPQIRAAERSHLRRPVAQWHQTFR